MNVEYSILHKPQTTFIVEQSVFHVYINSLEMNTQQAFSYFSKFLPHFPSLFYINFKSCNFGVIIYFPSNIVDSWNKMDGER